MDPERPPLRLVVLASGNGSNLQAVLDACKDAEFGAGVVAVVSDRPEAFALERASHSGLPAIALPCIKGSPRTAYDSALADAVSGYQPDFILLLGWMRILSTAFLSRFPGQVVNLHPALPGTFPGTHAIERALEAFRAGTIPHTGVMTHFVPDEGVDSGPAILTAEVPILPADTLASLEARIHSTEHRLILETIKSLGYKLSTEPQRRREEKRDLEMKGIFNFLIFLFFFFLPHLLCVSVPNFSIFSWPKAFLPRLLCGSVPQNPYLYFFGLILVFSSSLCLFAQIPSLIPGAKHARSVDFCI